MRDLARELDLSPGNLSYHFPTKEALISALVEDGHASNNAVTASSSPFDFVELDRVLRSVMQRDIDHRWLMRDAGGLLLSLPTLRAHHERMQRAREERIDRMIARLVEARLLDGDRLDLPVLRVQLLTQVFFWLPSAMLAAPDGDPAARLDLHVRAVLALFDAVATPAGRRQLRPLLQSSKPVPRSSRRNGRPAPAKGR